MRAINIHDRFVQRRLQVRDLSEESLSAAVKSAVKESQFEPRGYISTEDNGGQPVAMFEKDDGTVTITML